MKIFASGLNISGQLSPLGSPVVCCPTLIENIKNVVSVHFCLSYILWNLGDDCKFTGHCENFHVPQKKVGWKIKAASENRLAAVSDFNDVFVFQDGDWKKVTLQYIDLDYEKLSVEVKEIALQDNSILILNCDGKTLLNGIEVCCGPEKIVQIASGFEHFLALNERGEVLSWGGGMRGQLGNGILCQTDQPEVIIVLQGIQIRRISAGGWHSCALSDTGDAYLWGWNESGQLGFPSKVLRSPDPWRDLQVDHICCCNLEPDCLNSEKDEYAIDGIGHSANHDPDNGHVSLSNGRKKLKTDVGYANDDEFLINVQSVPKLLDFWSENVLIKKVCCGSRHTVILLDDESAWSIGWNRYGQLGICTTVNKDQPSKVPIHGIKDIFAGLWNSAYAI